MQAEADKRARRAPGREPLAPARGAGGGALRRLHQRALNARNVLMTRRPRATPTLTARGAIAIAIVIAASLFPLARTARADDQQSLVDKARITVESFAGASEMSEMRKLMGRARAVLVVPQLIKIGYVVGGAGGSGVLLARDQKTGRWSAPAFYTMGAGSLGLQIGASASEMMLL